MSERMVDVRHMRFVCICVFGVVCGERKVDVPHTGERIRFNFVFTFRVQTPHNATTDIHSIATVLRYI